MLKVLSFTKYLVTKYVVTKAVAIIGTLWCLILNLKLRNSVIIQKLHTSKSFRNADACLSPSLFLFYFC